MTAKRPLLRSIAARLVVSGLVLSAAVLLIAGVILSTLYHRTTEQAFDGRLHVYLQALVADVVAIGDNERTEPGELDPVRFDQPLSGWYWQISRLDVPPNQDTVKTSKSLFASRLPSLADVGAVLRPGGVREAYVRGPDERELRVIERIIDLGDDGRYLITVAGNAEEIVEDSRRFNLSLFVTFGILGLALAISSLMQVRFGLGPLRRLRESITAIRRGDALHIDGAYPREVAPVADELNLLVDANREVIDRARTQVGNLAHALKTPLSVLINEAGNEDSPLAEKVRDQAAVMRDQMQYYLDRARAAARAAALGSVTEVEPVTAGLVRTFEKICRDRGIRFAATVPPGLRFRGEKQDLEEMLGNLVDNAGKWASERVEITIAAAAKPLPGERPAIDIVIDDDGPGLPPDKRAEATRRGRRLDETKPGSGLGLSIVNDLAGLYGGTMQLEDSPLGGLRARLLLPAV
jgi:signal transduction histidine kinase